MEKQLQEISSLFSANASTQGKFEKRVEQERTQQLIKESSRFMHLIALPNNSREYIENLFSHKFVFCIIF